MTASHPICSTGRGTVSARRSNRMHAAMRPREGVRGQVARRWRTEHAPSAGREPGAARVVLPRPAAR